MGEKSDTVLTIFQEDVIMNEKLLLTKKITETETNIKHLKKLLKN